MSAGREPSPDEALARAAKPSEDALRLHPFYRGKVQVLPKCAVRGLDDFAIWYTPGVAAPCRAIAAKPELVYEHTNKGNTVAVVTDGTRVLGLGDIGPEAGLPVMEGKALLFKYLGGVDAVPICLDTKDPDELIRTVQLLQPSFGGINLEDIAQPKCFRDPRHAARAALDPGLARRPAGDGDLRARRPWKRAHGRRQGALAGAHRDGRDGRRERRELPAAARDRGRSRPDRRLRQRRASSIPAGATSRSGRRSSPTSGASASSRTGIASPVASPRRCAARMSASRSRAPARA